MLKIECTLKNTDKIVYYTNSRKRAQEYFNNFKKDKFIKEIKTQYLERGKYN